MPSIRISQKVSQLKNRLNGLIQNTLQEHSPRASPISLSY